MAILDRVKTDLSSFDYKKIETTRSEPSNVKNLPTPPSRVTEIETTITSPNFSKLANTDRGSNEVKQPSSAYLQVHRFNDGFGNIALTAIKSVDDVARWAKWSITPKGLLFHIKQAVLQRFNARRETRIYNPLGVLGSVLPFVHLPRHTSGTFLDFKNPPRFPDKRQSGTRFAGRWQTTEDGTLVNDMAGGTPTQALLQSDVTDSPRHEKANVSALGIGLGGMKKVVRGEDYDLGFGHIKIDNDGKLYSVGTSNQLQVPYHGTQDNKSTSNLPKDFIDFRIRDMVNGKWLIFPAHLGTITDTVTPTYSQERYIGRPDAVHIYTGTDRSVGFDFKVAAFTKQEIPIIQEKMNYLMGLGYPTFKELFDGDSEKRPVAPYIELTVGDLFVNTPGYFSGITITIEENATWELDPKFQIPQVFTVGVEFVYIGKHLPETLGKHYDVDWLLYQNNETSIGTFQQGWGSNKSVENTTRPTGKDIEYIGKKRDNWSGKFVGQIDAKAAQIHP